MGTSRRYSCWLLVCSLRESRVECWEASCVVWSSFVGGSKSIQVRSTLISHPRQTKLSVLNMIVDNVATPIAAMLGDVVTLVILGGLASLFAKFMGKTSLSLSLFPNSSLTTLSNSQERSFRPWCSFSYWWQSVSI